MAIFPFGKANRVRDMTTPIESIPVHMPQPKMLLKKSSVIFDVFDYTTHYTDPNSDETLGLQIGTFTKMEVRYGINVDIWLTLEGQFCTTTETLDFGLRQKLNINRDWSSPEEIDPAIKPKLYNDLYEAFTNKFNSLFPDYKLSKMPTRTGMEIRATKID